MIIIEDYRTRLDGVKLIRTYSDIGKRIIQNETGIVYDEAIDVEDSGYTYTESEEDIENEENTEGSEDAEGISAEEALAIIVGGE